MRAVPVPDHVRERTHRDWAEERIADGRRKHENRVKGLPVLRQMDNGREFAWGARLYHAPPVPFEAGLDALELQQRWAALVRAAEKYEQAPADNPPPDVQEWRAVCREVARLFKVIYKPVEWWRRALWLLIPSPLRDAPPSGVGSVLGGFSALRTRDAIDSLLQEARFPTGTSPAASTDSSPPTPPSVGVVSRGPRFGPSRGKPSLSASR